MNKVEQLECVWDNGLSTPEQLSLEELQLFIDQTGARRVVARRWLSNNVRYKTHHQVRLLQDQSGLVFYENDDPQSRRLVVMNGDGSRRFTLGVPRIDNNSHPAKGYLSLPPSSARFGGIDWGCEGNDGYTDYLFDFDWNTGKLLRYARPSRPW